MKDKELLEKAANIPYRREHHGLNKTPEHQAWVGMKQRCYNPKKADYKHYGGRGIVVCDEWKHSFLAFLSHVGKKPSAKHSLDRIDVDGSYEPGNVRWATHQHQVENTRVVKKFSFNGEAKSYAAWERHMGLAKGQITARISSGWSVEEAVLTPSVQGQKKHMNVKRDYSECQRDSNGRCLPTRRAITRAAAAMAKE